METDIISRMESMQSRFGQLQLCEASNPDFSETEQAYNLLHERPMVICDTCGSHSCDGHPYL